MTASDLKINHQPMFDIEKVIKLYSEDGVTIKYVCTTDLKRTDVPVDVYYRSEPHPEFGNFYFGLFSYGGKMYICDADSVESLEFGMIRDKNGVFHYSQSLHHYHEVDDRNFIDGGREYIRTSTGYVVFRVCDGEFEDVV
jgi:hypothetical protein